MSVDLSILYVSSEDVSRGNGPGVNEREFIRTLHKLAGGRAHFLIPRPTQSISDLPASACTFYKPHYRHNPLHFAGHLLSQVRAVQKQIRSRDFDLLVLRVDLLPLAIRYLVARHKVPYAIKTLSQGTLIVLEERSFLHRVLLSGLNTALIRKLVTDAIVTDVCSPAMIEYFSDNLQIDSGRFLWIDNAVDTSRFSPMATKEARAKTGLSRFNRVAGFIGSRPAERGGGHLVEVAPRLLAEHPKLGIVIVGDGPGLSTLKNRARKLGLSDRCVFTGQIPFEQVPPYCNSLDVGVSISSRAYRFLDAEIKVREYLACGKPVVASAGSNEFLSDHQLGTIVDEADLTGIEQALNRWISMSKEESDRFRDRARGFVCSNLSYEAAVRHRLSVWSGLVPANPTYGQSRNLIALAGEYCE